MTVPLFDWVCIYFMLQQSSCYKCYDLNQKGIKINVKLIKPMK